MPTPSRLTFETAGKTAPMKVFVTGADGLLGSNLVRELIAAGHSVKVLEFPGSSSPTLRGLDIETVRGDLLDPGLDLPGALGGVDAAVHCAAITDMWASSDLTWKVNLEGTKRLLDASVEAGVKRFVFVGSASSFEAGTIERPGGETGSFPPEYEGTAYMESKHAAAKLVRQYASDGKIEALAVAPTFMIGRYDSRPSGGEMVRQAVLKALPFSSPGGRNFADAGKIARAVARAVLAGKSGETYILGGENLTYMDFFSRVARIAGASPPKRTLPPAALLAAGNAASAFGRLTGRKTLLNKDIARFSLMGTYYSSAKAERELGLERTDVDRAIEDSIRSLREYGHLDLPGSEELRGKVAVVTGASRGVGFSVARALGLRGAKVVMTARGDERLQDSAEKLRRLGCEVLALAGDAGNWSDAERVRDAAMDEFGRVDILVNNAGVSMRGQFSELDPDVLDRVNATNLMGCITLTRLLIDQIVANRGNIVFISSIAGLFGLPGASVYCATKKALTGLAESLRLELIPKGVHVGVVYLGFTEHDPDKRILAADGSLVPPDRPAHNTQAGAAELIAKMIVKRKKQLVMTPAGVIGYYAYRAAPWFLERAVLFAQSSSLGVFKRFS